MMTRFLLALSFLFSLSLHCLTLRAQVPNATARLVPAAIVFGDSIVDTGNNNVMKTIIKSNFPPYGNNFIGRKPTGRFCNGKIASDFIASVFGLKEFLPPYLGTNLAPEDLLTGVTFASSGAGYDPLTSHLASVLTLDDQLELFKEYKEKLKAIAGEERAADIISTSLYVVCTGSDDIANTYFPTPLRKHDYDIPSYANFLLELASTFVQKLYQLGARKIGVVNIPPIGCVPSQRTLSGGISRGCGQLQNEMATLFNSGLSTELQRLTAQTPGAKFVAIDIYTTLLDIIQYPFHYGFEVSTVGCCGTGTLEVSYLCNSATAAVCPDVSKYVFWDSYHPTEKTYKILVDSIYSGYIHLLI